MPHRLFTEIERFNTWAEGYSPKPQAERGGEWELDYPEGWQIIYKQFEDFARSTQAGDWSTDEIDRLLYIIARDNECQALINSLHDDALVLLAESALARGEMDCKWQIADTLQRIADKQRAVDLIERFVNDPEEYVNRRALMAMARLDAGRTETYCRKHWERTIYGDMDEYQRIAILHSLKQIGSPLLKHYLELAKADGREYLVNNAVQIEGEVYGAGQF